MKNRYFENLRKQAKQYKKSARDNTNWNHEYDIKVYHMYDGVKQFSWWDDVAFIEGSQQVSVWWIHPRMKYSDKCSDLAHEQMINSKPARNELSFESTPNYVKLGKNKNRKKIVSYTMKSFSEMYRKFFVDIRSLESDIKKTGDVESRCSFKVHQYGHCRGVSICCPFEINGPKDLSDLADLVRKCLKDNTLFSKLFGDVVYNKDDWNKEFPNDVNQGC